MADLNSLPGIEVTVCVDDKPLKEYESTEDEVMLNEPQGLGKKFEVAQHQRSVTVKRFVESAAGKFFTIKCSVQNPYRYADCENSIKAATRLVGNGRFVGEIEVRVFQVMYLSKAGLVSRAPLVSKTEIPENLLKGQAKSHSTLFGQGEAKSEGKYQKMEFLDDGREYPIAIFKFQHGSRGWRDLETLGVVERSPEPESSFGYVHNSNSLPMPISEPRVPEKSFRDTTKEAKLSNNNFRGGSTSNSLANTFTPPSIKQEVQDAEPDQNFTPTAPSVPASSSNVIPPINSASWNVRDLDPTQTDQLFGQFLQYLQTHGGGQPAQAPPPFPVGTTTAAFPNLSTSTSSSGSVATATSKPPLKREKEGNGSGSRKRRRKAGGKVTIDLTEDDSDDDVVIDLDSD
ncbi:hypothetical protein BOTCAL_0113g00100 [Botryotinia calthae]|uniref:DUF7918 domain-containing protein n=1 Tax=Botryotinia calthae TaxID=38488 RepID=A0A4Y8D7G4_9HELO|nr:hypothetical protein BOTCAL_0113g00100 [Botryotinia calthae]